MTSTSSSHRNESLSNVPSIRARWPIWKQAVYILVTLVTLFLSAELALSAVYFRVVGNAPLAIVGAVNAARERVADWKKNRLKDEARARIAAYNVPPGLNSEVFSSPGGDRIREHFSQRYEAEFSELVTAVRDLGARLVVFFPIGQSDDALVRFHRTFFADLARRHGALYIDMAGIFDTYGAEDILLLPFNAHLSKFGNNLVAKKLKEVLEDQAPFRSRRSSSQPAATFGDLPPQLNTVWDAESDAPYRIKTNRYGLRMDEDFPLDTAKQKILVLGDSMTFGPYLANHDLYTTILGRMMPDAVVMNAGNSGYTISDELTLFRDKARLSNPDIVVLQVFHNDLTDLFYFKRNEFDRLGRVHEPTPIEIEFIEAVHKSRASSAAPARGTN